MSTIDGQNVTTRSAQVSADAENEQNSILNPLTGEQVLLDPDVVISDHDREFMKETGSLFESFFTDFGIIASEPGTKPENVMNLIFDLITKLKAKLQELKQQFAADASDIAMKVFDTVTAGVDKMLDHAKTARMQTFLSAGASMAGAGVGAAGSTSARFGSWNKSEGGVQRMQTESAISQGGGQVVGSTSKFFDASSSFAQTEGQAATKEADALSSFLQTVMQTIQELSREIDSIWGGLNQTQSGTTSAERPRILA